MHIVESELRREVSTEAAAARGAPTVLTVVDSAQPTNFFKGILYLFRHWCRQTLVRLSFLTSLVWHSCDESQVRDVSSFVQWYATWRLLLFVTRHGKSWQ